MKRLNLILPALILLTACHTIEPTTKQNFQLGTFIELTLYDGASDELFDELFAQIASIESLMSLTSSSELLTLNETAGQKSTHLSSATCEVIQSGLSLSTLTNGHFNIAIEPLVSLWKIGTDDAAIPAPDLIQQTLHHLNYEVIEFDADTCLLSLPSSQMGLDLGGIAKGYAADEVLARIKEADLEHALINLGGNVLAHGGKPNHEPFKVGIQDPFSPRGTYLGKIDVLDGAVATSGIYERFFEVDNVRYHHILDSKTGYPVNNELAAVVIMCERAMDADALSTAAFSYGLKEGMAFINTLNDVEAIFITHDKTIYLTEGAVPVFELFDLSFNVVKEIE